MTQEEKELLLKDLCARLHYGVKVSIKMSEDNYSDVYDLRDFENDTTSDIRQRVRVWHYGDYRSVNSFPIIDCKPYLRPMSSITEEEKEELNKMFCNVGYFFTQEPPYDYGLMVQHADVGSIIISEFSEVYNWLNAHHFDYRGLIEKGLALKATEDMYIRKK